MGLGWRRQGEIVINPDRPFIRSLDDLPIPLHHLLPFDCYRAPLVKGPYTFIVTGRGCPAGCKFCIKHVNYQYSVRLRSPEKLVEEMAVLSSLGIHHVQMYADLFTASRDHVMELCELIQKKQAQHDLDLQQPGGFCRPGDAECDGKGWMHADRLGDRERQ